MAHGSKRNTLISLPNTAVIPRLPDTAVIHMQQSLSHKRFLLIAYSSLFMRLAVHPTALRAWLVLAMSALSVKTRRATSLRCIYGREGLLSYAW